MEQVFSNEYVELIFESVVYLATSFFMFYVGKLAYSFFNRDINIKDELVEKDNLAFSIAHTGYFVGLVISIGSAIVGESSGIIQDVIDIVTFASLAIVLLNLSIKINDKFILRGFSLKKEISEDQNVGVGLIEAASAIASGFILFGAVVGDSEGSLLHQITTATVFWLVGQVLLIITSKIYQLITPYDDLKLIEQDNVAAGVGFAGSLIAISILLEKALQGDFFSWVESFENLAYYTLIGLVFLPIVRWLTDKILLPGRKLTDEIANQEKPNIGAGVIEAFAYIGGSVLITWCL